MERILHEEKSYRLLFPSYFRIYEDRVEAYFFCVFWPYKHTTSISDIKKIRIVEGIPWYVGWGLRIAPGRRLYFAIHHGKSVEIERKSDDIYWKKIILSVKDPEKFMSIVKERLKEIR